MNSLPRTPVDEMGADAAILPSANVRPLVAARALQMRELLCESIRLPSVSGNEGPLVHLLAAWARRAGFEVDLWQASETELQPYPQSQARHLPLAGRPTAVIRLAGSGGGPSLGFNAHSDVVAAPEPQQWDSDPWAGAVQGDRVYGRGACDTKGPMVSALWALSAIKDSGTRLRGDLFVELIPGEEDCVGLGTLTSHVRGYAPDALIVLEPTESLPRCASRGGTRFEINCLGKSVHGTVKWAGVDAIAILRAVLDCLAEMETAFSTADLDSRFDSYPIARPITVDAVHGGRWQGMVCDSCLCAGYFELLPSDDLAAFQQRFSDELRQRLARRGHSATQISVAFVETYAGHQLSPTHAFCRSAQEAVAQTMAQSSAAPVMSGFNAGCEAGLRASLAGTPTLVWGPGSLLQAHAINEYVSWQEVQAVAEMFVRTALAWTAKAI